MKKFEKICLLVIDDIKSGRKKVGDKIPSIRAMSKKYQVSRNTIVNAYNILLEQSWIKALPKSGFYVSEDLSSKETHSTMLDLTNFYNGVDLLEQQLVNEYNHRPGEGRYPREYMDNLNLDSYLGHPNYGEKPLYFDYGYGDPAGNSMLRGFIVEILKKHSLSVAPQNLLMTHGTNHSLDLIIRHFLNEGDSVIVESPGYYPLFSKLKLNPVNVIPIKRTKFGIDVNSLETIIKKSNPKIFFLQPFAHNPTGTDLTVENINSIKSVCMAHNVLIVEDDPFLLIRNNAASYLFGEDSPVIYLSSFSKTVSASLGCGFIVASTKLIKSLTRLKMITIINTSSIIENILNHLISSGTLNNHLQTFKTLSYEKSADSIKDLSKVEDLELYPHNPGGHFLWFRIPMDDRKVLKQARSNNIFIAPGNLFFPAENGYFALRINKFYVDQTTVRFLEKEVFNRE
ncbi:PLP-dependent aminotransferase family protein [Psychrobacter sp. ANT_WB68]|uniref:aminotransferase-like domain-containing protein n=1 Tax=Psychrobacter sp. ANT_WB68 TaxID=2597355 RepID=UPI0011F3902C|nr:PLP-dependent aminotransferase family protein [Psychrobacter sp. ANT_WB68]KAA0915612.1 PLP-dependent aminotransferase family protein [Psychrobacter sp. ANT_WB68]